MIDNHYPIHYIQVAFTIVSAISYATSYTCDYIDHTYLRPITVFDNILLDTTLLS